MDLQGHIGNDTTDRPISSSSSVTRIIKNTPASCRGILIEWSIRLNLAGNAKVKIFRDDGANYVFAGEGALEAASIGVNTFSCRLPIEKGDFLAIYTSNASGGVDRADTGGVGAHIAGDCISTLPYASWTANVFVESACGEIRTKVVPL